MNLTTNDQYMCIAEAAIQAAIYACMSARGTECVDLIDSIDRSEIVRRVIEAMNDGPDCQTSTGSSKEFESFAEYWDSVKPSYDGIKPITVETARKFYYFGALVSFGKFTNLFRRDDEESAKQSYLLSKELEEFYKQEFEEH